MRVSLPPGAVGVQTQFGGDYADRAKYDRSPRPLGSPRHRRSRSVEVTDPRDLELVRQSPYLVTPGFRFTAQGWDCRCGHGCWAWQRACPRCGTSQPDQEDTHE